MWNNVCFLSVIWLYGHSQVLEDNVIYCTASFLIASIQFYNQPNLLQGLASLKGAKRKSL